MTATAHALVAAAIARTIPNPYVSVPLAFASHFIMDCIPHWDFGTDWRDRSKTFTGALAIAETALGITLAYFLFRGKVPAIPLLVTMAASELPDWLEAPYYIFFARQNKKELGKNAGLWERLTWRIYKTENIFHTRATFPLGLYTQIAVVGFFLLLLK